MKRDHIKNHIDEDFEIVDYDEEDDGDGEYG